ncbi:MAG TPA: hypothetical protein VGM82_16000 [Gemmatimonadaceae bacterium]|jgi:hypothetical protein
MKKLIVGAMLLAAASACTTTTQTMSTMPATTSTSGNGTGAPDPQSALRGFLEAAKSQNLQGISTYWGDKDGTVRGRLDKTQEEQREIIMARCLRHDHYDIVGDAPAVAGGRTFAVSLTRPGKSATTNFDVVPANDHRWYVQSFDMDKLADYCR